MSYCRRCGAQVEENSAYCAHCGAPLDEGNDDRKADFEQKAKDFGQKTAQTFEQFNQTADTSAQYQAADIAENKVFAVIAYLYLLVLVPIFAAKNSPYARFHANQGLVLSIFYTAYLVASKVLGTILWPLWWLLAILNVVVSIAYLVLLILGAVNAGQGKAKELPLIGGIRILK